MGISGIADYSSLFANYKVPQIREADLEQLKRTEALTGSDSKVQENVAQPTEKSQDIDLSIKEKEPLRPGLAGPTEITLSFDSGEDSHYIGKDSDIEALDMQKAISDMKKDQVLQQYQYFVGRSENLFHKNDGGDGLVFMKF